jgi:predicted nucleotidyltransferase
MISKETVQQMTQRIIENFSPQKVIVFGSWARGETNSDSDIDFLVVMPYNGSKRELQVSIRRYLKDFDVPKDVIVASPEELAEKRFLNGYIYQPALSEGKVLYER